MDIVYYSLLQLMYLKYGNILYVFLEFKQLVHN